MNNRGSILVYLIFFIILTAGSYYIWTLKIKLDKLPGSEKNVSFPSTPVTQNYSDWKPFTDNKTSLSFKIPADWSISDDNIASQFQLPSNSSAVKSGRIYNYIGITTHTGVLYAGVYDIDLFNSLFNLEENKIYNPNFLQDNNIKFTKLSSGKISSGQKYVIFKPDSEKTTTSNLPVIQSYILKSNSIIILTLNNYDDTGLETFKQIPPTASIGQ